MGCLWVCVSVFMLTLHHLTGSIRVAVVWFALSRVLLCEYRRMTHTHTHIRRTHARPTQNETYTRDKHRDGDKHRHKTDNWQIRTYSNTHNATHIHEHVTHMHTHTRTLSLCGFSSSSSSVLPTGMCACVAPGCVLHSAIRLSSPPVTILLC